MKYFSLAYMLLIITACRKNDFFPNPYNKPNPGCEVISINADKQDSYDFYMIKTLGKYGQPTHIKTQIRDVYGRVYLFDYNINYSADRAIFTGKTKEIFWVLDNPDDEFADDPAMHKEGEETIDNRSFEVFINKKTGFASFARYADNKFPILEFTYDKRSLLDSIKTFFINENDNKPGTAYFDVTNDIHGNIVSIFAEGDSASNAYFGNLGVRFMIEPKTQSKGRKLFYEPEPIYVSRFYSLLQTLDWGPFQPDRERSWFEIQVTYPPDEINIDVLVDGNYLNHKYDDKGKLTGYDLDADLHWLTSPRFLHARNLVWNCDERNRK